MDDVQQKALDEIRHQIWKLRLQEANITGNKTSVWGEYLQDQLEGYEHNNVCLLRKKDRCKSVEYTLCVTCDWIVFQTILCDNAKVLFSKTFKFTDPLKVMGWLDTIVDYVREFEDNLMPFGFTMSQDFEG